ncbi:SsrA-binding protein [Candidatus Roizmanbacteria bacterium RIFCSPHIGHO2_02_FULL_40_9]|uniref:SsrA-binding protein n=1 Tax=Candidatus Roizmanbacteria bacterium RIFCSPHIGHO2_02_FULL_40_9 TaxID=1802042 RepID=A0A1F7HDM5_9BACT|nr:MAG: SsrA-binding protein [Candidatus Roizmanbacteria bacterium RIFCSPHIGHO2_02_FULL_40_9]
MYAINKTAKREYEIIDRYEAGLVLYGPEVKSIKNGGMKLTGAYVKMIDRELFLINAHVAPYAFARIEEYNASRTRKLLLSKKELIRISSKLSQSSNLTVIPLSCYNSKAKIKLEIAIAKGRKIWEKKRVEKNRDEKRRETKEIKEWLKK